MILANVRAEAWKYAALAAAVAVLALGAALGWSLWRAERAAGDAAAAVTARDAALADLTATRAAMVRDALAASDAAIARRAVEAQVTEHHERARRVEDIAHEARPPVPAVCPLPDPRLVRELAEGADRVRAAADRLRGFHGPADPAPEPARP